MRKRLRERPQVAEGRTAKAGNEGKAASRERALTDAGARNDPRRTPAVLLIPLIPGAHQATGQFPWSSAR